MRFGHKIRELRREKGLGQRTLAGVIGTSFTYVSKVENHRLDFGEFPSEEMIRKLAAALDANDEELMLLAKKIPDRIRLRVLERPDAFRQFAELDDTALDGLLAHVRDSTSSQTRRRPRRLKRSS